MGTDDKAKNCLCDSFCNSEIKKYIKKNCGLTIEELWMLTDDLATRTISFDDSGVHFENILWMINKYKNS